VIPSGHDSAGIPIALFERPSLFLLAQPGSELAGRGISSADL
jgi:hypothetical protein